ncbi:hypothetical protein AQUCO_01400692v1 [Aquilegia coerulea]|uniref:DUF7806 domain-containing protein n=1 Tax=Aquilegia coerulea TaxID=218851 RepID=A0A2G5DXM0_AQUCA|nr:hypothetical protein AQUCO_01400692v1 [Aquilegia coerulea]
MCCQSFGEFCRSSRALGASLVRHSIPPIHTHTPLLSLSPLFQSNLKWIPIAPEEDAELSYHVLSLGTIGRVAIDWMKEDIAFSLSMFPAFLMRVSKVVGLQLWCKS